jgi:uncharacterized membrane protein YdfJ with MMPL/SSD domain
MLGSLTVLPALSKLGDKVDKGKIPFLHRLRHSSGDNRFWKAILTPALRRPAIAATAAAAVLVAMALPVLHIHTAQSGLDALPNSAPTVPAIKKIQHAFSNGTAALTEVAIRADVDSPQTQHAINDLKTRVTDAGLATGSIDVEANKARTVARVDIPLVGEGTDGVSNAALAKLRNDILPATIGKVDGADYAVTRVTAASHDQIFHLFEFPLHPRPLPRRDRVQHRIAHEAVRHHHVRAQDALLHAADALDRGSRLLVPRVRLQLHAQIQIAAWRAAGTAAAFTSDANPRSIRHAGDTAGWRNVTPSRRETSSIMRAAWVSSVCARAVT